MYCFIGTITVTNLNLMGGATIMHAQNKYQHIYGEDIHLPAGEVYFDTIRDREIWLHAPLSGSGTVVVRGHGLTSYPGGTVALDAVNSNFKGTVHVTSQVKDSDWMGIFSGVAQWQKLVPSSPESLGAPLETFNPKAMLIDSYGELSIGSTMEFSDVTRGFCFGNVAQVRIPSGKVATFRSQWTLGGEVFVRSSGVLALGGTMRFVSQGNIVDAPQSGKNLLTFPEGGSLKVLARNCIDGATVTFSNETSRLIIDADTQDLDLRTMGVKNVKTDHPFAFPGDSLNIEFAGTRQFPNNVRRLGLMTVSSSAATELRNKLNVSVPVSLLPNWGGNAEIRESVDSETGNVTFWLDVRPTGLSLIIR